MAPLGASAVLVFAVPSSPLAQPWAVVGGNTVSALVGIACVHAVGSPELAAALAVGLAIALMFALRCLHPPGGASALLVALGGVTDPRFALYPVLVNSLLLVAVGMAYNQATRRSYPHRQLPAGATTARDAEADAIDADLDAVLARYNQVLDISRDDLKALLADTQLAAYQRKLAPPALQRHHVAQARHGGPPDAAAAGLDAVPRAPHQGAAGGRRKRRASSASSRRPTSCAPPRRRPATASTRACACCAPWAATAALRRPRWWARS